MTRAEQGAPRGGVGRDEDGDAALRDEAPGTADGVSRVAEKREIGDDHHVEGAITDAEIAGEHRVRHLMRSPRGRARQRLGDAGGVGVVDVEEARAPLAQLVGQADGRVPEDRHPAAAHQRLEVGREDDRRVNAGGMGAPPVVTTARGGFGVHAGLVLRCRRRDVHTRRRGHAPSRRRRPPGHTVRRARPVSGGGARPSCPPEGARPASPARTSRSPARPSPSARSSRWPAPGCGRWARSR